MKKSKNFGMAVIALTLVLGLCACTAQLIEANIAQDSPTYVAGEDNQNFLRDLAGFTQGDGGYYFVDGSAVLHFYDPDKNQVYPVCDRANCTHNDSGCPAYLSPMTFYSMLPIHYYDGNIYLLGHEDNNGVEHVYMYQLSPKTLKRRPAAYLLDSAGGISINCFVHRGYVYYVYDGGEMEQTTTTLYRTQLGQTDVDAPEKVYTYSGIGANLVSLSARGNYIYFKTSSYADVQGNGYTTALHYLNIHDLSDTGEITQNDYGYFAGDDGVYYFQDANTVMHYDMQSGQSTEFCTAPGPCFISGDSQYLYFDNDRAVSLGLVDKDDRRVYVYDKTGQLVTQFAPRGAEDICYFGGEDVLLFEFIISGEVTQGGLQNYYALDKTQLLSGEKAFHDIGT